MKPSNVLLDDDNTPKIAGIYILIVDIIKYCIHFIIDFGVARENAGTLTMTGIGTPTYMAPEMLKGRKYSDVCEISTKKIYF